MQFLLRFFSSRSKREDEFLLTIKQIVGSKPKDPTLYSLALRHSSSDKSKKNARNNERLEFLGDAILGAVVADHLYKAYPGKNEGFLTSMRSKIVSRSNLNTIGKNLGLEPLIISKLDKRKPAKSICGDALEALIGAVYLDLGLGAAMRFIQEKVLSAHLDLESLETHIISYKGQFIEWAQKERKAFEFQLLDSWGMQHNKTFKMGLYLENSLVATGRGPSKKLAEENAAEKAFKSIENGSVEKA